MGSAGIAADRGSDKPALGTTPNHDMDEERTALPGLGDHPEYEYCSHEIFPVNGRSHLSLVWIWRNERKAFLTEV